MENPMRVPPYRSVRRPTMLTEAIASRPKPSCPSDRCRACQTAVMRAAHMPEQRTGAAPQEYGPTDDPVDFIRRRATQLQRGAIRPAVSERDLV
jgi:hypothetical protein